MAGPRYANRGIRGIGDRLSKIGVILIQINEQAYYHHPPKAKAESVPGIQEGLTLREVWRVEECSKRLM